MTTQEGTYSDTYTPDTEGSWSVHASWGGEELYPGFTSPSASFTVYAKSFYEETWFYLLLLLIFLIGVALYIRIYGKSNK